MTNIADAVGGASAAPLTVNWLESTLPMPRRADTLTQFTGRWPLEKQPRTAAMPSGSVTCECRHGKTSHESPWMFIASDGEPKWSEGEIWACHLAWSGNQTYRIDNLPPHETLIGAGELLGPGILQHADRIWASDSNDPRDRVDIQRYTELIVPPEMIGAHVGPSPAHSTWRATELSYRAAISLEGCSGFEWNILECSDEEADQLRAFVSLYKELRGVLHHGTVMHSDFKDPALRGRGVVSCDGTHAVWVVVTVTNLRDILTERLRMPGLDADRMYRVRLRDEVGEVRWGWNTPQWMSAAQMNGFKVSGRLLGEVGLQLPPLWPLEAMVLDVEAM